jgi:hypothetical protein
MDFQSIALPSELRYLANAGANIECDFYFIQNNYKKKSIRIFAFFKLSVMLLAIDVGNTRIKGAVFERQYTYLINLFFKCR